MTDTQILSIAIMVVTVLTGALFNNFRINDMRDAFRDTLRAEMTAVRAELTAQMTSLRADMDKNHSEMLHRFGDLDSRLTRIEERFMR